MYQITDEQFQNAQRIIEEYHRERQQQADWELEEDEDEWIRDDEDDGPDMLDSRYLCKCGAWSYDAAGKLFHHADCVCGAE